MIRTAENIAKDCYESRGSVDAIMDQAEESIFNLIQNKNKNREFASMQSIVVDVIDQMEEASRRDGKLSGIPTGFLDLDQQLTGLHKGELVLVAARPSMGKTALVLNIAKHVIMKERIPTVIFSLEMDKESLVSRLIAMDAMVDAQSIRTGNLTDSDWDKIIDSTEKLSHVPLFIEDNSSK